ncbi:hypothetical protein Purlil1_12487 [Purpureocillium lilacinum]|uniref:SET domain-containing protein n=1 Tax=Purpureocillium lilacinum TaxID=33203 RepID=A0ABR0BGY6_PURLI|nr:hypothetical protein Purlil1_12487 [Purpureocillium lilacinum]
MMISDMALETHHRGYMTLLRVRTPPQRITAVMAIVEDEQGTAVLLQLYHQPEEVHVPAEEILQPGSICILKEPFFKYATDGSYSLRVDHLSDILWLRGSEDCVSPKWRSATLCLDDSTAFRIQGNEAVEQQEWAKAHKLYSTAIDVLPGTAEAQLAHLNRSFVNLRLGRPEQALSDAAQCRNNTLLIEKRLFRQARALYELGSFAECQQVLQELTELYPENTAAKREADRVKARLQELGTGEYSFDRMYKSSRATPPLVDCATFSAAVRVDRSPEKGLGLFTTKPVTAGELLLCEKAFAYSYADGEEGEYRVLMNLSTKRVTVGAQAQLLTGCLQKLYHNPQTSQSFRSLYHGSYKSSSVSESDGFPVVDTFLVEKIISLNVFGAPRSSLDTFKTLMSKPTSTKEIDHRFGTCGVWLLASRINHSCLSNCHRSFVGDMQIVRAARDMEAGTELLFCYQQPMPFESYDEAQKKLNNWGFLCHCQLCIERKQTTRLALQRRKAANANLQKYLNGPKATDAAKALKGIERMAETYALTNTIQLELWDPCFALGANFLLAGNAADAVKMTIKGLEALGYNITASPPICDAKQPTLEVTAWGQASDYAPWAFLNLFKAYQTLAPELCAAAKLLVETSYSIVVGEKETVLDIFPELTL